MTLVDFKNLGYPAVDTTAFPDTSSDNHYWASAAWGVLFTQSFDAQAYVQNAQFLARCVR